MVLSFLPLKMGRARGVVWDLAAVRETQFADASGMGELDASS